MPVIRSMKELVKFKYNGAITVAPAKSKNATRTTTDAVDTTSASSTKDAPLETILGTSDKDFPDCATVGYPSTSRARRHFRTPSGKCITPHQWAVYDFTLRIPRGKVTTYKIIALAICEGSPRSVGAALRVNPFAPYVPCHRVIASNYFIGGFFGDWGLVKAQKAMNNDGVNNVNRKLTLLAEEGVEFDRKGFLLGGQNAETIWNGI